MKREVRQSNFELMRIISMFMIVLWHIIIHGHVIENCQRESILIMFEILEFICVIHVNSFIVCTGYFQSKSNFKMSNVLKNIILCWFYSVIIMLVISILNKDSYGYIDIVRNILSFGLKDYWFMNNYIILYCLSPFFNKFIDSINKQDFRKFIIVLLILFSVIPYITSLNFLSNDGYTLYNFIFLYFIGAYLRKYSLKKSYIFKKFHKSAYQLILICIFLICVILNFSTSFVAKNMNSLSNIFNLICDPIIRGCLNYSNPLIIIQTICYFCLFETFNINNKLINNISKLVIGVYLLSDNKLVRSRIYKLLKIENVDIVSYKFIIYVILITLLIFIVCAILEFIRQKLFKFINRRKISKKSRTIYRNWIDNLGIKINW